MVTNYALDTDISVAFELADGYIRQIFGFIGITDVTFIAVDKRFKDDQALIRADAAVDALIGQL